MANSGSDLHCEEYETVSSDLTLRIERQHGVRAESMGLGTRLSGSKSWLYYSLTVTVGKWLNFSAPRFLKWFWGLNEFIHVKGLGHTVSAWHMVSALSVTAKKQEANWEDLEGGQSRYTEQQVPRLVARPSSEYLRKSRKASALKRSKQWREWWLMRSLKHPLENVNSSLI